MDGHGTGHVTEGIQRAEDVRFFSIASGDLLVASFGTVIGDGTTDDTAALQAIIDGMTPGAKLTFETGKTYLVTTLNLKENCRFVATGTSTIKLKNNTNPVGMLVMAKRVTLDGLTLNGNKANNTGLFSYGVVYGTDKAECTIKNCTIQNAAYNAISMIRSPYTTITNNTISGATAESIFLYRGCSYSTITGNTITTPGDDGIKLHSNAAAEITATLFNCVVSNNTIDYRGTTQPAQVLAIEIFRHTPPESGGGAATGFTLNNNTIYGPDGVGSQHAFGISIGGVDNASVTNNKIYGPKVVIGLENAGGEDVTFDTNTVDGFSGYGYSISQVYSARTYILNGITKNAATTSAVYGVQVYGGGGPVYIRNSAFTDAGERAIFFNDTGDGGDVTSCTFATVSQAAAMNSVYLFQVNLISITSCTGTSGSGAVTAPTNNGSTNITQSGNVWS